MNINFNLNIKYEILTTIEQSNYKRLKCNNNDNIDNISKLKKDVDIAKKKDS